MERIRELLIDPVCGEEMEPDAVEFTSIYQDDTYYFCSLDCQLDFEEAPEKYLGFDA